MGSAPALSVVIAAGGYPSSSKPVIQFILEQQDNDAGCKYFMQELNNLLEK